jgi:hypothetical protein
MTTTGRVLTALAALSAACAGSRPTTLADVVPPVAWVDPLPPGASVAVNGVEAGRAPLTFPVPDQGREYAVRVTSPGFEPLEARFPGAAIAGGRLDLVLRPQGFGTQRELRAGEPAGLLQAAAALLRVDRAREAIAYAGAAAAVADAPEAHRLMGLGWRRLGNRDLAVKELSLYLSLAPGAPDRGEIERMVSSMTRDIDMSPARKPGG